MHAETPEFSPSNDGLPKLTPDGSGPRFAAVELAKLRDVVPPGVYFRNSRPLECEYLDSRGIMAVVWGVSMRQEAIVTPLAIQELNERLRRWDPDSISFGFSKESFLLPRFLKTEELSTLAKTLSFEIAIDFLSNGQCIVYPGGRDQVGGNHASVIREAAGDKLLALGHLHPKTDPPHALSRLDGSSQPVSKECKDLASLAPSGGDLWILRDTVPSFTFGPAGIGIYSVAPFLLTASKAAATGIPIDSLSAEPRALYPIGLRVVQDQLAKFAANSTPEDQRTILETVPFGFGIGLKLLRWNDLAEGLVERAARELQRLNSNLALLDPELTLEQIRQSSRSQS